VHPLVTVGIAALLSLPIGLDRELRGKAAGLRTMVVIGTACAALGQVSVAASGGSGDATRIAAQVVTGVGFLGAGVIFAAGNRVYGLTTAASVFGVAAVGLCVGLGEVGLAASLVAVTMVFLWPVDLLTDRLVDRFARKERSLRIVADDLAILQRVHATIVAAPVQAREVRLEPFGDRVVLQAVVRGPRDPYRALVADLERVEGTVVVTEDDGNPD